MYVIAFESCDTAFERCDRPMITDFSRNVITALQNCYLKHCKALQGRGCILNIPVQGKSSISLLNTEDLLL